MAKKKSSLPKSLTTVTPFSRVLAAILFIFVPIIAFIMGMQYQQNMYALDEVSFESELRITETVD